MVRNNQIVIDERKIIIIKQKFNRLPDEGDIKSPKRVGEKAK